jgi:hypothetical protein
MREQYPGSSSKHAPICPKESRRNQRTGNSPHLRLITDFAYFAKELNQRAIGNRLHLCFGIRVGAEQNVSGSFPGRAHVS